MYENLPESLKSAVYRPDAENRQGISDTEGIGVVEGLKAGEMLVNGSKLKLKEGTRSVGWRCGYIFSNYVIGTRLIILLPE